MSYTLKTVLDYSSSEFERSRNMCCEYCGVTTDITRDHIIPVSFSSVYRSYNQGDTVRCCRECNSTLGSILILSFDERAEYLICKYQNKYRKILNMPHWDEDDLKDMDSEFKRSIKASVSAKTEILQRLDNLSISAFGDSGSIKVKQFCSESKAVQKTIRLMLSGMDINLIADHLEIDISKIREYCRDNKYNHPRASLLYESGIDLDIDIIKFNKNIIKIQNKK